MTQDIIIVGGGLTGETLACALAAKGLKIALIDAIDHKKPLVSDGRSFALSRSSYTLFSELGIWPDENTPITKIHTSDGVLPRSVDYDESDVEGGPLGYVVDSVLLKSRILKKVLSFKNIKIYSPTAVVRLKRTSTMAIVETDGEETLKAGLCIAADGKSSSLREWAQIPSYEWGYDQMAIVCNMAHTLPHYHQAFEHFLTLGPLAFVPRPGNESGLVWSVEKAKGEVLMSLSPEEFTTEVQALFGEALGTLTLTSQRWSYPLGVTLPKRIIDTRLALVGDAAHTFHPVAGQGLNVGLRDVAVLADVLQDAFSLGLDLGSTTVLKRYQKRRRMDVLSMTFLTDGLVRVFSNQSRCLAHVRSLGFGVVRHCKPLKNFMIRHAMGMTSH